MDGLLFLFITACKAPEEHKAALAQDQTAPLETFRYREGGQTLEQAYF